MTRRNVLFITVDQWRGDFLPWDESEEMRSHGVRGEDDQLGGVVGLGDRRRIAFLRDIEATRDNV